MEKKKQITVFGSQYCPGCVTLKKQLEDEGIKFTYADISENLSNLKAFLDYRDKNPMFEKVREEGKVGIPFIVINRGERLILGDDGVDFTELK